MAGPLWPSYFSLLTSWVLARLTKAGWRSTDSFVVFLAASLSLISHEQTSVDRVESVSAPLSETHLEETLATVKGPADLWVAVVRSVPAKQLEKWYRYHLLSRSSLIALTPPPPSWNIYIYRLACLLRHESCYSASLMTTKCKSNGEKKIFLRCLTSRKWFLR